jgi:hypothetical protein
VKETVQNALLLSGLVMFACLPMFRYQFQYLSADIFIQPADPVMINRLALMQSFIVFLLAVLCSLVGFTYARRLELPGFGTFSDLLYWLPLGLLAGVLFAPVYYFLVDRALMQRIPEMFPASPVDALALMIGGVIPQEVIARFGLLTIGVYFWKRRRKGRPWPLIAGVSLFGAAGAYVTLAKFYLNHKIPPVQMGIVLATVFLLQWLFCELYLRRGFVTATCIHLGLTVKLLIYALFLR